MILEISRSENVQQNRLSRCKDLQAAFMTGEILQNEEKLADALEQVQQTISMLPDAQSLVQGSDQERFVFEDFVQIVGDHIRDIAMGNGGQSQQNIEMAKALWQKLVMLQDEYNSAADSDSVAKAA